MTFHTMLVQDQNQVNNEIEVFDFVEFEGEELALVVEQTS